MTLFYYSGAPIVIPKPDSLFAESMTKENQQFRVDVVKPNAPIESLSPNDILATVFATTEAENPVAEGGKPTAEPELTPKRFSLDLSPYAGQTVQLRPAVAVTNSQLLAGVDASLTSTPIPPAPPAPLIPPSNEIKKGKLTLDKSNGTGSLAVTVPGAGTLTTMDASTKIAIASMTSTGSKGAKGGHKPALIRTATLHPTAAGTVAVPIKPTASGRRVLEEKGRLRIRARLTFTPSGGTAATQIYRATLVRTLRPRR